MKAVTGVIVFDKKYSEWATYFPELKGEYGRSLIIGHTTGIHRRCSGRNLADKPLRQAGRKPRKALTIKV